MSAFDAARGDERLRVGGRLPRTKTVDAQVSIPPRFSVLLLLAAGCVLAQSTVLANVTLRGAHVDLLLVLVVWTGLRCGVVAGGWLGLIGGLLTDALGGGGANVLADMLAGFGAGLLANRFFWDSLPVFVGATAVATVVRGFVSYVVLALAYGERGAFARSSHEWIWSALLNGAVAAAALYALRAGEQRRPART